MAETPASAFDLSRPRRVHVVGVGGAGMSAIATVLVAMGHTISGSDLKESPGLDRVRGAGVSVFVGHGADHVGQVDAVTASSAVPASNSEIGAARARGLPVLRRSEVLAGIAATRRTVAVAGTHGKTTTSSMLAQVMVEGGLRPSFIIGGELNEIGTGAAWDDGQWLVLEADESDGTFLEVGCEMAVLTSVEPDHLEHYGGFEGLVEAFDRYLGSVPGPKVVCADDPIASRLAAAHGAVTYGASPSADYRMVAIAPGRSQVRFSLEHQGADLGEMVIPIPGLHNARNAAAALAMGLAAGVDVDAGRRALARFAGVARRFQFRGERDGVSYVDDYAHLPGEVRSVVGAAVSGGWDRVICVFQPHRYSRTATIWPTFADAFQGASVVLITEIYPAGEPVRPGISGQLVADAILGAHPGSDVRFRSDRASLLATLGDVLRPGDLCLVLGAGDIASLVDELMDGSAT